MAEKNNRKKRRAYLDSFQKNEKGNYEYHGDLYFWAGMKRPARSGRQSQDEHPLRGGKPAYEERSLRRELTLLWGLCAGMLCALIAAGCVEAPGVMNCAYVLIPYTVNLVAGISVCWGLCRLTAGGNPLRAYICEASVMQIPGRAVCTAIGAGAAAAGELIWVFRNGMEGKTVGCILFFLLEGAVFAAALVMRYRVKQMNWEKKSTEVRSSQKSKSAV